MIASYVSLISDVKAASVSLIFSKASKGLAPGGGIMLTSEDN